jgi:2-phospho-L-lactate guanylyltransferase (CobY/MobA/RfbA family)
MASDPWIMLHADLPLVTASSLLRVAEAASSAPVLVPSHDGGTNAIGAQGPFPFAYGTGSFHRHFAAVPNATIISTAELAIDIDSPAQLAAFPELIEGPSLSP